jgi:hypothetical protein
MLCNGVFAFNNGGAAFCTGVLAFNKAGQEFPKAGSPVAAKNGSVPI